MGLETTSSASFAGLPSASMDPEALRALVDSASVAIVREFLAKRRYRKTLDTLHSELVTILNPLSFHLLTWTHPSHLPLYAVRVSSPASRSQRRVRQWPAS